MYKLAIFAMLFCAANAGIIGGLGHGALVAAPVVAHAPIAVAHAPLATSYQNNNQISLHPTPVVATHAVAAPVVAHAPIAVAHAAPVAVGIGYGHGLLH